MKLFPYHYFPIFHISASNKSKLNENYDVHTTTGDNLKKLGKINYFRNIFCKITIINSC